MPPRRSFSSGDIALLGLLARLKAVRYRFITPTPATHARILARPDRRVGGSLRDALGWSLPFARADIDAGVWEALHAADMLTAEGALWRSRVRVSSLGADLFLHSAYPTVAEDSVFFGPDSYRFALLIEQELTRKAPRSGACVVDIGTGTGVGGVIAKRFCDDCRIVMTDINPLALRFAALNAAAAGLDAQMLSGGTLDGVEAPIDIALANPPYIIDDAGRDYRDGGDLHGTAVALDMARMAVERLSPAGRMILYTGSAIIGGDDPLAAALVGLAAEAGCTLRYREIDPDVFGEELARPAYADVERLAVVAAILERE